MQRLDAFINHRLRACNPLRQPLRHALAGVLATCAAFSLGTTTPAQAAAAAKTAAPGSTWQSIARLPDWSGTWALTVKDHEAATKETRDNDGGLVPLTPKYRQLRANMRRNNLPESLGNCLPAGIPGVMLHRIGMEILFTPGRITILTENGEIRRINTDGRAHLSLDELDISYEGDSLGQWQGNTLVVDTIGFPKGSLFKNGGLTATRNTRYVERIFLKDKDHLQIDSEISDPEIFTTPFKATRTYERVDYALPEPQCVQTSHTVNENTIPTPPSDQE